MGWKENLGSLFNVLRKNILYHNWKGNVSVIWWNIGIFCLNQFKRVIHKICNWLKCILPRNFVYACSMFCAFISCNGSWSSFKNLVWPRYIFSATIATAFNTAWNWFSFISDEVFSDDFSLNSPHLDSAIYLAEKEFVRFSLNDTAIVLKLLISLLGYKRVHKLSELFLIYCLYLKMLAFYH